MKKDYREMWEDLQKKIIDYLSKDSTRELGIEFKAVEDERYEEL